MSIRLQLVLTRTSRRRLTQPSQEEQTEEESTCQYNQNFQDSYLKVQGCANRGRTSSGESTGSVGGLVVEHTRYDEGDRHIRDCLGIEGFPITPLQQKLTLRESPDRARERDRVAR